MKDIFHKIGGLACNSTKNVPLHMYFLRSFYRKYWTIIIRNSVLRNTSWWLLLNGCFWSKNMNFIIEIYRWLYKTLFHIFFWNWIISWKYFDDYIKLYFYILLLNWNLCKQNRKRLTFCSYLSQKVHTVNRVTLFHFSPFYFDSYVICVKDLVSGLYGGHWPFIKTCYLLLLCLIFNIITAIFVRRSKSPESLVTVTRQDQFHCYVSYHNGKFLKITDQV